MSWHVAGALPSAAEGRQPSPGIRLAGMGAPAGLDPSGELVTGHELITALGSAIAQVKADLADFKDFLHVELLVQPGSSTRLPESEHALAWGDLLGIVQISLRPRVQQYLEYGRMTVKGPADTPFDLSVKGPSADILCTVLNLSNASIKPVELKFDPTTKEARLAVTLPKTGEAHFLFRTNKLSDISIAAPDELVLEPEVLAGFPANHAHSLYFSAPDPEWLAGRFTSPAGADKEPNEGNQWGHLRSYLESLNSTDPSEPQIQVPASDEGLKNVLPEMLAWLGRFFDAGGAVYYDVAENKGNTGDGPWLACAYPRAGSPAYVAPDASGRLQYDHLIADHWAHNYRFYIRPYARYDKLWESLRQSPLLFPDSEMRPDPPPKALPDTAAGGLDVVLDRMRALSMRR